MPEKDQQAKIEIELEGRTFRARVWHDHGGYWRGEVWEQSSWTSWVMIKKFPAAEGRIGAITLAVDMITDYVAATP